MYFVYVPVSVNSPSRTVAHDQSVLVQTMVPLEKIFFLIFFIYIFLNITLIIEKITVCYKQQGQAGHQ